MNNHILSTVYRLTEPGKFIMEEIKHDVQENDVVVKPYLVSLCHADLRYYTGNRRQEALEAKLPMALFHEGIGIVQRSHHREFKKGDKVVIVPSIPGYVRLNKRKEDCCDNCKNDGYNNYCLGGEFLGSGYDGLSQSHLVISGDNLVHIPKNVTDDIALLAELCSIPLFAIHLVNERVTKTSQKVAVFGDGPLGYLTTLALHFIYNIPKESLLVFGAIPERLAEFECFANTALVQGYNFKNYNGVGIAFECTGGVYSSSSINQAIDLLDRQGNLVLMGVTEELVPINTRDILEKGIQLHGSSRSTVKEFKKFLSAFPNGDFQMALGRLISDEYVTIRSVSDLTSAMESATKQKQWEKTYLFFDW